MRLTDLDPRWYSHGNSPDIVGVTFDCPCCAPGGKVGSLGQLSHQRLGVLFVEEIDRDGLPNEIHWTRAGLKWHRTGDTFDTLSLTPSVDASKFGHWHGTVTGGECK